jgi:hypothetical protein
MNFREKIVSSLPVPNLDNNQWIYLTATLIGSVSRATNIYTFVLTVWVIGLFLLALFVFKTSVYVFGVYSQRLREQGSHVWVFLGALGIAIILMAFGLHMVFSGDYNTNEQGRILVANTFCFFSLFVAVYDWWLDRPMAKTLPSLKGVSVTDVLKTKQRLRAAKEQTVVK